MKIKTLVTLLFFAAIFGGCAGNLKTLGLKEKLQHDDFFYSIESVERVDSIGNLKAEGKFCIVKFKVQNDAKRVEHSWKNNAAFVTDENGDIFENNNELQKLYNSIRPFGYKDEYFTRAGTSDTTILIFDIPAKSTSQYIMYRGVFLMGDLFDGNKFKKTRVELN